MVEQRGKAALLSELERLQRRVAELEERLQQLRRRELDRCAVLQTMSELVAYQDAELRVLWANNAAAQALGRAPEELVGKRCYELWAQRDAPCPGCPVVKCLSTGRPERGEVSGPDGRTWLIRAIPVKDERGRVNRVVKVTEEITKLKAAEETLRQREQRAKQFVERLVALPELANELLLVGSFDELCRRAVELGTTRLGFERMSIWLRGEEPGVIVGTFGIDERGRLRDERGVRARGGPETPIGRILSAEPTALIVNGPLYDHQGKAVGWGSAAFGRLWDGEQVIGCVCVDNLLEHRPITDEDREILGLYASTLGHLCALKRTEEDLQRERELLHALMDSMPDAIYFKDTALRYIRVNKAFAKLVGISRPEEAVGKTCFDFFTKDHAEDSHRDDQTVLRTGEPVVDKQRRVRKADGQFAWFSSTKAPIRDRSGRIVGIVGVARDITERVKAEDALRESEELNRLHFENATDVIYSFDREYRLLMISRSIERLLGYKPEELIGRSLPEVGLLTPESMERVRVNAQKVFRGGRTESIEYEFVAKDGTIKYGEASSSPLIRDGEIIGLIGIVRDVTERKHAQREKEALMRMYRDTVATIPSSLLMLDAELNVLMANRRFLEHRKMEEADVVGKNLTEVFPESLLREQALLERVRAVAERGGNEELLNVRHVSPDHPEKFLDIRICGIRMPEDGEEKNRVLLVIDDVTEHRMLEEQLRQAQKMEAIGTLAGGVAHDFNNLLTAIMGYASMLRLRAEPESETHRAAQQIQRAAERAAELTQQLLGFARKGKRQNIRVDLHELLEEAINLLSRTIDKRINMEREFRAANATILGDPSQIEQVILNLAINARDAMPEGGRLVFGTEEVLLDEAFCRRHAGATPGQYVMLSVSDTGCGIPEEIRDRIFEPFFTTKQPGEGTGMGLAMVYGIVKNHGGSIYVESEVGRGTTFKVYFPVAAQPAEPVRAEELEGLVRGRGRILLVDDEEVVREVGADVLRHLGYEVITAADGLQAIDYYKNHAEEIDLVIIDLVMPRMNGRDCFLAMKAINPNVRAILSSGYEPDGSVQELLNEGALGFAQKPYNVVQLSQTVARALKQAAPNDGA